MGNQINHTPAHFGVITDTLGSRCHRWERSDAGAGMQSSFLGDSNTAGLFLLLPRAQRSKGGQWWKGLDAGLLENLREHSQTSSCGRKTDFTGRLLSTLRPTHCVTLGNEVSDWIPPSSNPPVLPFIWRERLNKNECTKRQRIGNYYFASYYFFCSPSSPIHFVKAISICVNVP